MNFKLVLLIAIAFCFGSFGFFESVGHAQSGARPPSRGSSTIPGYKPPSSGTRAPTSGAGGYVPRRKTTQEGTGASQTEDGSDTKPDGSDARNAVVTPGHRKYLEKKQRYRKIDDDINQQFGNLSFSIRHKQQAQMRVIEQLRQEKKDLVLEIYQASVDAFRDFESIQQADRAVIRDMVAFANARLEGEDFEFETNPAETLGICDMIIEKGGDVPQIRFLGLRAAYASQNFDVCEAYVAKLEEMGETVAPEMVAAIASSREAWAREQEIRNSEANLPTAKIVVQFPRPFKNADGLTTNTGVVTLQLYEDHAPQAVANFVSLVENRNYENNTFFGGRRGEFIVSGCPLNNGEGNPGYQIFSEASLDNARSNFAGTIAMIPDEIDGHHGSQFLFSLQPNPNRDGSFTVFGRVIEGMDIIRKIRKPTLSEDGQVTPPVQIVKTEMTYKRPSSTYKPNKVNVEN